VNAELLGPPQEPVEWHLTLRLLTSEEQIRAARKVAAMSVRAVHGSDEDAAAVELAVGEILTNARLHAYAGGVGPVELEIRVADQAVQIVIHDEGTAITSVPVVPTAPPERGLGGRGLYIVGQLMDEASVISDSQGRGLLVELRRRLHSGV
jgi:anti-sigma regulatory factor (Ser/Thr protein kinase)